MHYQFRGKLAARHLNKEQCIAHYSKACNIFMAAGKGKRTPIMQSFFQFYIDDLAELGLEKEAMVQNKLYKQTLKDFYEIDEMFYIAYTIDIVA